jgi:hypothetical protein
MDSILFLAADPTDAVRLRLGEEVREIRENLQRAKNREFFKLEERHSVRPGDLSQSLLDVNPKYVHFSGHGTKTGMLCVEDGNGQTHPIEPTALANLFESFSKKVKCVILNACYSEKQAQEIVKHIDYVIGMNAEIGDKAAIAFSIGFYQGLGANRSVEDSYKLGCTQIQLQNIPENLTPILHKKSTGIYIMPKEVNSENIMDNGRSTRLSNGVHPISVLNETLNEITSGHQKFTVKKEFAKELQHVDFVKQNRNSIKLEEVFVFPNLSKSKDAFEKETLDLEYFLHKKEDLVIIKGDDSSGKTALLRWLFLKLGDSYSPIFIDTRDIAKNKNFNQLIKNTFQKEYVGHFEEWMQIENRVAIIDNYHHNIPADFLTYLSGNFSMVVVSIDDEEWIAYLKDDPDFAKFSIVTISQLTLSKQEELIKKWKALDFSEQMLVLDDLEIDKLEAAVNSIVTKNRIVPRYPFYILSILQTLESFMPKDYAITAYGHCYQALVAAQIIKKGIKNEQVDDCFNFLRELSFDIYNKQKSDGIYDSSDYQNFKEYYKKKFFIQDSLLNRLENDEYEIIKIGEQVNFAHDYIYYYFVGMYFAFGDRQGNLLNELIEKIYLKQNALIVIFTVHHAQNKELLENILAHCICSFDGVKTAELTIAETHFMNDLIAELPSDIVSKKSVPDARKEVRDIQDKELSKADAKEKEADSVSSVEINKSLRILEVLGQILKNRGGSFERAIVLETLESTIDLGLRILNLLLENCKTPEFEEWLSNALEDAEKDYLSNHNKPLSDERKKFFVAKTIQIFGYMITVSMLNRISASVSTEKLTEAIRLLSDKKGTPAYKMISFLAQLSQNGIDIPELKSLIASFDKSKNYWAKKTLSFYVQGYLSTHNIKYSERQKASSILKIDYVPNKQLPG